MTPVCGDVDASAALILGQRRRSEHADELVSVDQFDTPELAAPLAPLKAADRDQPRPDATRRPRTPDRHLPVSEDRPLLIDPAAEIRGRESSASVVAFLAVGFAASVDVLLTERWDTHQPIFCASSTMIPAGPRT